MPFYKTASWAELSAALFLTPGTLANIATAAESLVSSKSRLKTLLFNQTLRSTCIAKPVPHASIWRFINYIIIIIYFAIVCFVVSVSGSVLL